MKFKYNIGDKVQIKPLKDCEPIKDSEPYYMLSHHYEIVIDIQNKNRYLTITECFKDLDQICYFIEGINYGFLEHWLKPTIKEKLQNILKR